MKRILEARMKIDFNRAKKGFAVVQDPNSLYWHAYEKPGVFTVGWLIASSESDLITLHEAGIVEIKFEEEKQEFKVGDWVMRKDGNEISNLHCYKAMVVAFDSRLCVWLRNGLGSDGWTHGDFVPAPSEPPADVLKEKKLRVKDFRPWKTEDTWWDEYHKRVMFCKPSEIFEVPELFASGPHYILEPDKQEETATCIGCDYLIGIKPDRCRLGNDTRAASCCHHSKRGKQEEKPTEEDKRDGLKLKYAITHADGSSCDPDGRYFVLRYDFHVGCDQKHVEACRRALREYAYQIQDHLPKLSLELRDILDVLETDVPKEQFEEVAVGEFAPDKQEEKSLAAQALKEHLMMTSAHPFGHEPDAEKQLRDISKFEKESRKANVMVDGEKSCDNCGNSCDGDRCRSPFLNCEKFKHWTPKPAEKSRASLPSCLFNGECVHRRFQLCDASYECSWKKEENHVYHEMDIVGTIKELSAGVEESFESWARRQIEKLAQPLNNDRRIIESLAEHVAKLDARLSAVESQIKAINDWNLNTKPNHTHLNYEKRIIAVEKAVAGKDVR